MPYTCSSPRLKGTPRASPWGPAIGAETPVATAWHSQPCLHAETKNKPQRASGLQGAGEASPAPAQPPAQLGSRPQHREPMAAATEEPRNGAGHPGRITGEGGGDPGCLFLGLPLS